MEWSQQLYLTADGDYIFMGSAFSPDGVVAGNPGGKDFWEVKLDSSRNIVSQKCYGGSDEDAYGKVAP